MPFARADVIALLTIQDKLANKAKDIAGLMTGREMEFPDEFAHPMRELLTSSIRASAIANNAIDELSVLIEVGIDSSRAKEIYSLIDELDAIESDNDEKQIVIRAILFSMEKDLPPVDVMFYYKIINFIGNIADVSQSHNE